MYQKVITAIKASNKTAEVLKEKGFIAVDEERCNRVHQWVIDSNGGNNIQSLDIGDTLHYYDDSDDTLKEVIVEYIEYILEKNIRITP